MSKKKSDNVTTLPIPVKRDSRGRFVLGTASPGRGPRKLTKQERDALVNLRQLMPHAVARLERMLTRNDDGRVAFEVIKWMFKVTGNESRAADELLEDANAMAKEALAGLSFDEKRAILAKAMADVDAAEAQAQAEAAEKNAVRAELGIAEE